MVQNPEVQREFEMKPLERVWVEKWRLIVRVVGNVVHNVDLEEAQTLVLIGSAERSEK